MTLFPFRWQEIPAATLVDYLTNSEKEFLPDLSDLEALLTRFDYRVVYVPRQLLSSALLHTGRRAVLIPQTRPDLMRRMLLHETAEILLGLPIAPEFHYPPSDRDEFHAVATLVEQALVAEDYELWE